MSTFNPAVRTHGATALFVLLWSSGAIASRWSLDHASPMASLVLRFSLALFVLLALRRSRWLPPRGVRWQAAGIGLLLPGGYTLGYLLALEHGMAPGILATLMGVQPLLTLILLERRHTPRRVAGLLLALGGLALLVLRGVDARGPSGAAAGWALAALGCMTAGAILQKRIRHAPIEVLPLQYAVSLGLYLLCAPFEAWWLAPGAGLVLSLGWLALGISVGATLLLYRMIQQGNLVDVTSLFYLVPVGTALLDYLLLGHRPSGTGLLGMAAIIGGLVLALRRAG